MEIAGKIAIVTGGGAGIGRALAVALAHRGARVIVADLDAAAAAQTAAVIGADSVLWLRADASSTTDITALIALAHDTFGPPDIYLANAGIMPDPGHSVERQWNQALEVNVLAHVRAASQLIEPWITRGGGYFLSTASAAGLLTQVGAAPYAVSKHAAVAFAEWLAITYGDKGIGVSCLCPMGVDTDLLHDLRTAECPDTHLAYDAVISAGEILQPADVAELTMQAIEDERFLVLPHPRVLAMYRRKAADLDGWIKAMRQHQQGIQRKSGDLSQTPSRAETR